MLHAFAKDVVSESILFHDKVTTHLSSDAIFRRASPEDVPQIVQEQLDSNAKWVVAVEGRIAGTGDILFHYNRPYGDIYMSVAESFRRRGLGSYFVQELATTYSQHAFQSYPRRRLDDGKPVGQVT